MPDPLHLRKDNLLMKTRLAAALAGLAALTVAGLALAAPAASATETQNDAVCATWKMRGTIGAYPNVTFGGKPQGSWISLASAKLVKPEGQDADQPGVEFAAKDLDVQAPEGNELVVSVEYATSDGATTSAGAVRLFGYKAKNANTLTDAPDWKAEAGAETGRLVFTLPAGQKLGTLGLVYDASNNTRGSVTFTAMTIGVRAVRFTPCPEPEPTVTAQPTTPPTGGPTPTATASPRPEPTTSPVAGEPTLPVTGAGTTTLLVVAGLLVAAGAVALVVTKRRRVTFKS